MPPLQEMTPPLPGDWTVHFSDQMAKPQPEEGL